MSGEQSLKERLLELAKNEWSIPEDLDIYQLALESMQNLGSLDPELRDDLALTYLWIVITKGVLPKEQIKELYKLALSNEYLFCGLGREEDDSVFKRTFTILVIYCMVYYHNTNGQLFTPEEFEVLFEGVISYVSQERDLRGYVPEKGWAHAAGHFGDALRALALCDYINAAQLQKILDVVKQKVDTDEYAFINEEAERMTSAIVNVVEREILADEQVVDWIRSFGELEIPKTLPGMHYWKENIKNLLRSLYFRLKFKKTPEIYLEEIEAILNGINARFNTIKQ